MQGPYQDGKAGTSLVEAAHAHGHSLADGGYLAGDDGAHDVHQTSAQIDDAHRRRALAVHTVHDPFHTQLVVEVGGDLRDHGLDEHLGAAHVQLLDHRLQGAEDVRWSGDHQGIGVLVRLNGDRQFLGHLARRFTFLLLFHAAAHPGEHRHQVLGLSVAQVDDARVALGGQGRVQVGDDGAQAQPAGAPAAHENAVGALVGDEHRAVQGSRAPTFLAFVLLFQGIEDAHHFGGRGVFQADDFDFIAAGDIDALDDVQQALDVGGPVGDDEDVAGHVGRQMALLGDQGPQDRHQLRGRYVVQLDHPRDHLVPRAGARGVRHRQGVLFGAGIGYDLDDLATGDSSEAMDVEDRKEDLVDLLFVHGA